MCLACFLKEKPTYFLVEKKTKGGSVFLLENKVKQTHFLEEKKRQRDGGVMIFQNQEKKERERLKGKRISFFLIHSI